MSVYLDASAIVPLFVPEPNSRAVADAIGRLDGLPYTSDFGAGEVASTVSRYVRTQTHSETNARLILTEFDRWSADASELLDTESRDMRRAIAIVRRFELKLRFPDALHIAICANRGLQLMTLDRPMAAAAEALGVPVQIPE